jgi:Family of unknown function (DUF5985)
MTLGALAYSLCLATALGCAVLLTRAYRHSGYRLLFWSAACFWGLTLTNGIAVVDLLLVPEIDLYGLRLATGLLSMIVLVYGMAWEADSR